MQNLEVKRISFEDAKTLILNIHYARRIPCVQYAFGLFSDGIMVGCVTYGKPATPTLCKGVCGEELKDNVLELNRLVMFPKYNVKNYASFLVSHSLKMLPPRSVIVSYADQSAWGHIGYVYQACNFLYTGTSAPHTDPKEGNKHPRHLSSSISQRVTRSQKHRYVAFTGTKRDKKFLRSKLKYEVFDNYPKGDSVKYNTANPTPLLNDTVEEQVSQAELW